MKKFLRCLLTVIFAVSMLAVCAFQSSAADELQYNDGNGNTYKYIVTDGNVIISGFSTNNTSADIVIPAEINGKPVTEIRYQAFYKHEYIRSVTFPDSIRKIGQSAFASCENLESINLPDGLEEIDEFAFAYCYKLTSDLYITESVKVIGGQAFEDDYGITSIVFDENSKCKIYNDAFSYTCIESITLPKGTECGPAFSCCEKLRTADIQGKPLIYETYYISGGKKVVTLHMPGYMFEGCESLETVRLSDSFDLYIGMFSFCKSLKSVKFGKDIEPTVILENTFRDCKQLKKSNINISFKSVNQVDAGAFQNCENMNFDMQNDFSVLGKVGDNAFYGCKLLHNLSLKNISSIGKYAFAYCSSLSSIEFPDGYTFSVGAYAFANCDSLKSVEIPAGHPMSKGTFWDCTGIETVTFSGRLSISNSAKIFLGCTGIKTIILDNNFSVKNKAEFLYYFNKVIDIYSLPLFEEFKVGSNELNFFSSDGVLYRSEIDKKSGKELVQIVCYPHARSGEFYSTAKAFSGKDCFVAFGEEAFRETKYLKKLEITQNCVPAYQDQYDYNYADGIRQFYKSSVEEIVFLKKGIDFIDPSMFEDSNIRTIDLSEVITVEQNGFKNCKNLKNVDLPKCKYIENGAFEGCESLTRLQLINTWKIGSESFKNCTELKFVNFGINACKIGSDAFKNCDKVSFYCDEDSQAYTYALENNIPIISINISFYNKNDTYEYTGSEIRPALIIAISGMVLTENKDYTVEYFDNIKYVPDGYSRLIVHFIGDFEGLPDAYRQFYIVQRNINSATAEYEKDNVYEGEDIRPAVVIKLDGKTLIEDVDYKIIYQSGADTGTMLFKVIGMGNYKGEADFYYNIVRRDIAEATVEKLPDCIYTGDELCPLPVITWNGFTLVPDEDYEVRYFENVNAGFGVAVIYGKGNFCGTQRVKFRIFGKGVENAAVSEIPDMAYNGDEIRPEITVTVDGAALKEGTDYTVEYINNTEQGTAEVIISGIGNYSGVIRKTFNIYKNSVNAFTVFSDKEDLVYSGSELKPEIEVYFGTEKLSEGVDYEISIADNISAGTATVTVIGIGRFEGERTYTFTIQPCEISEKEISVSGKLEFTGTPVEPLITVTKDGKTLENGKDYTVTYYDNDRVGTALATVEGIGNYCGSVNLEYEIYKNEDKKPEIPKPNEPEQNEPSKDNTDSETNNKNDNVNHNGTQNGDNKPQTPPTDAHKPSEVNSGSAVQIPNTDEETDITSVWFIAAISMLFVLFAPRKKREIKD